MEFIVPQFIEREAKIVGPLTFKQFLFVGTAGGICAIIYFLLPLSIFIISCIVLIGGAAALALYRKEGIPLYEVVAKSFLYVFKPKIYLWKKAAAPIKMARPAEKKKDEVEEEERKGPRLKVSKSSKLNDLFTHIETK